MARQILILAKNITEANNYARVAGLPRFTYRSVRSAGAIRGVRDAEVHILPSFIARIDRHAILAALAWAKSLEVFYVDPADLAPAADETSNALESGTPPTDEEIEEAYRLNELEKHLEPVGFALSDDPAVQAKQILESAADTAADLQVPDRPKPPRKPRAPKPVAPAAPAADDFF